jgi:hypothetical protein
MSKLRILAAGDSDLLNSREIPSFRDRRPARSIAVTSHGVPQA